MASILLGVFTRYRSSLESVDSITLLAYCLIVVVPPFFLYRFLKGRFGGDDGISQPSNTQEEREEEKKPLKPIMPPPVADLDPPKSDVYTMEELAKCDGTPGSEGKIWVAIKGTIFDVSRKSDVYGPGKSYHVFAGKDGSKGLGMSSLKTADATPDWETLAETERKVLDDWFAFFSKRYNIVGRVAGSAGGGSDEVDESSHA